MMSVFPQWVATTSSTEPQERPLPSNGQRKTYVKELVACERLPRGAIASLSGSEKATYYREKQKQKLHQLEEKNRALEAQIRLLQADAREHAKKAREQYETLRCLTTRVADFNKIVEENETLHLENTRLRLVLEGESRSNNI